MKVFKTLDSIYDRAMHFILPAFTIIITIMIFVEVICRYILHMNLGGAEELVTYFMIFCVWIAGGAAARDNGHLQVTLLYSVIKNEKVKAVMFFIARLIEFLLMCFFVPNTYRFLQNTIKKHQVSAGLMFPMQYAHMFLLIGSVLMGIYFLANTVKAAIALGKAFKEDKEA